MNLFGTDGIRGVANEDLTCETAFKLGQVVGLRLSPGKQVCVGKDTRISGDMLEASLVAGIASTGKDVIRLGVVTTPGLSFIVSRFNLGGGVMISASHNPFEYNGLKVFGPDGRKISDDTELEFSQMILGRSDNRHLPTGAGIGRVLDGTGMVDAYVEFLARFIEPGMSGLRIVIDAANGSASYLAPRAWSPLSANVKVTNCKPDGININNECGSTHPACLTEEVVRGGYHAGFAYDGDGDRCIAVDEKGSVLNGDHIMAIMASDMAESSRLTGKTVVGTIMANFGLESYLSSCGIRLLRTPVGDRFVLEEMERGGYTLGGEQSGHIIFGDILPAGDGMLTSLCLARVLARSGRKLSELASVVKQTPQVLVNVESQCPELVVKLPQVQQAVMKVSKDLEGVGRVVVRPSGTEPLVRIMVESQDAGLVDRCIDYLKAVITEQAQSGASGWKPPNA
jgi:phosphoglucosamine mutase